MFETKWSVSIVIVIDNGISDHRALFLSLSKQSESEYSTDIGYRCTSNPLNNEYFCDLLAKEDWEDLNTLENINGKFNYIINILQYHFEIDFPVKLKKCNRHNGKNLGIIGNFVQFIRENRVPDVSSRLVLFAHPQKKIFENQNYTSLVSAPHQVQIVTFNSGESFAKQ